MPDLVTERVTGAVNVAVTLFWPLMVTEQVVPVPEQAPDQPVKVEPGAGVAVSSTMAPVGYIVVEQEDPQDMAL